MIISEVDLGKSQIAGRDVVYIKPGEFEKHVDEPVEALVCSRATAAKANQNYLPNLKLIQLTSAGMDGVPVKELDEKGVKVQNAANVYGIPIAETVVLAMLELAKSYRANPENRIPRITRNYSRYITELYGKTALILGMGNIGSEVAYRLQGFGMYTVGYARHSRGLSCFAEEVIRLDSLYDKVASADYIISSLPGDTSTDGFISAEFIGHMKSDGYFINVGRISAIDQDALYNALKGKKIKGAALDMFEAIPNPVTNKFRRLSNVIVMPGVAAISEETEGRLKKRIVENLQACLGVRGGVKLCIHPMTIAYSLAS